MTNNAQINQFKQSSLQGDRHTCTVDDCVKDGVLVDSGRCVPTLPYGEIPVYLTRGLSLKLREMKLDCLEIIISKLTSMTGQSHYFDINLSGEIIKLKRALGGRGEGHLPIDMTPTYYLSLANEQIPIIDIPYKVYKMKKTDEKYSQVGSRILATFITLISYLIYFFITNRKNTFHLYDLSIPFIIIGFGLIVTNYEGSKLADTVTRGGKNNAIKAGMICIVGALVFYWRLFENFQNINFETWLAIGLWYILIFIIPNHWLSIKTIGLWLF